MRISRSVLEGPFVFGDNESRLYIHVVYLQRHPMQDVYRFVSCNKNSVDGNVTPVKSTNKKQSLPYFFSYEKEFFSPSKTSPKI